MAVAFKKHRFTVDEFMRMDESVLGPDLRIELIDGDIIEMPPINPPHQSVVNRLTKADYYATCHPDPQKVLLAIEVADRSLRSDLEIKAPLYAKTGIHEVWIVDINARCVHVHREPLAERYTWRCAVDQGAIAVGTIDGLAEINSVYAPVSC